MALNKIQLMSLLDFTVSFLLLFPAIGLIIYSFSTLNIDLSYIDDLQHNWQLKPILGIREEYISLQSENSALFQLSFIKGSEEGCNISTKPKLFDLNGAYNKFIFLFKSTYNSLLTQYQTNDFKHHYFTWKGKKLYIMTDQDSDSYNNLLYLQKNKTNITTCPELYKECGILDTTGNVMCVDNNKECPINHIIVNNNPDPPIEYNYSTISFEDGTYLHYTNQAITQPILVTFKIGDGFPCLDPTIIKASSPDAVSSIKNNNIKNLQYDNRYNLLDSIQKRQFVSQINLINSMSIHDEYLKGTYHLYTINYLGSEFVFTSYDVRNATKTLSTIYNIEYVILLLMICYLIIAFLFYQIYNKGIVISSVPLNKYWEKLSLMLLFIILEISIAPICFPFKFDSNIKSDEITELILESITTQFNALRLSLKFIVLYLIIIYGVAFILKHHMITLSEKREQRDSHQL